nr:hypothetical protein [Sedimentibacter sp.]
MKSNEDNTNVQKEAEEMSTILIDKKLAPKESLKEACKQMKLMREDKMPKGTWSDFLKELEEEKGEDQ